jgi:hypothetical protein
MIRKKDRSLNLNDWDREHLKLTIRNLRKENYRAGLELAKVRRLGLIAPEYRKAALRLKTIAARIISISEVP